MVATLAMLEQLFYSLPQIPMSSSQMMLLCQEGHLNQSKTERKIGPMFATFATRDLLNESI
jgi:hypothetical protein